MRTSFIALFLVLLTTTGFSQRFLLLEKAGTFKNFKYFEGDNIGFELLKNGRKVYGTVTRIQDSSFVVDNQESFEIGEVKSVIRERFFFSFFGYGAMVAGTFYFTLDVVNRAIQNDSPAVTGEAAIIGGSLVGAGWLLSLLKEKSYKVGKDRRWRLRVMTPAGA